MRRKLLVRDRLSSEASRAQKCNMVGGCRASRHRIRHANSLGRPILYVVRSMNIPQILDWSVPAGSGEMSKNKKDPPESQHLRCHLNSNQYRYGDGQVLALYDGPPQNSQRIGWFSCRARSRPVGSETTPPLQRCLTLLTMCVSVMQIDRVMAAPSALRVGIEPDGSGPAEYACLISTCQRTFSSYNGSIQHGMTVHGDEVKVCRLLRVRVSTGSITAVV